MQTGWSLYGNGQYAEACEILQEAYAQFPDDIEVLYALAMAFKKSGRKQEAINMFQKVLDHLDLLEDNTRRSMLHRLIVGHLNHLERGTWDLEELL